jgi:hypothetical protein
VAVGEHEAYSRLADPVRHRRAVILAKSRHCIVVDDLDGCAEHRVDLRFQFAPMSLTLDPNLWARAVRTATAGLFVRAFTTVPLKAAVSEAEWHPPQGWFCGSYGQREPAPLLLYSAVARLPVRVITVLVPTNDPGGPPPVVVEVAERGELVGLIFNGDQEFRCAEVS